MSVKNQLQMLKDNWLIVLAVVAVFLFLNVGTNLSSITQSVGFSGAEDMAYASMSARSMSPMPPSYGGSFNPEIVDRKVTKSANLRSEVEEGYLFSSLA